jgi:ubiquitin C-terminal hydrolase
MSGYSDWISAVLDSLGVASKLSEVQAGLVNAILSCISQDQLSTFPDETDKFLDLHSPRIINTILSTSPKAPEYAMSLNGILIAYVRLLCKLLFSTHSKFIRTAQSIVTDELAFFYTATADGGPFGIGISPHFKTNMDAFVKSDILHTCQTFYSQSPPFQSETAHFVLTIMAACSSHFDSRSFVTFLRTLATYLTQKVDALEDQEFRNCSEKQVTTILQNLALELSEDTSFVELFEASQMNFFLKMLKSEYLNKRFCALQHLMESDNLKTPVIEKLAQSDIIRVLLQDMHKELVPGFAWLFVKLAKAGRASLEDLDRFWVFTVNDCPTAIDSWSALLSGLPNEYKDHFWKTVSSAASYPPAFFPSLSKIAGQANTAQKALLSDCFLRIVGESELSGEFQSAIVLISNCYFPDAVEFREKIEDICLKLLAKNRNLVFALNILKRNSVWFDARSAREFFQKLLDVSPSFSPETGLYLDLLVRLFRLFDDVLSADELEQFEARFLPLMSSTSSPIQHFFEELGLIAKPVFPPGFFVRLVDFLSQQEMSTEFMILLFKEGNRTRFDSMAKFADIWVSSVSDLLGIDTLWTCLHRTSDSSLAVFLAKLYGFCADAAALPEFVERCVSEPPTRGGLEALFTAVTLRESIRVRAFSSMNSWTNDRCGHVLAVTGNWSGSVLLPSSLDSHRLVEIFAEFLLVRHEKLWIKINGQYPSAGNVNITSSTDLEVKSSLTETFYPTFPTDFIGERHRDILVSCLADGDAETAAQAFAVANVLPTSESERDRLCAFPIDCPLVLSAAKPFLLQYRLHAIGHLIETDWSKSFIAGGGALYLLQELVLKEQFYKQDCVVLSLINALVELDDSFLSAVSIDNLHDLIALFNSELSRGELTSECLLTLVVSVLRKSPDFVQKLTNIAEFIRTAVFHTSPKIRELTVAMLSGISCQELLLNLLPESNVATCAQFFAFLNQSLVISERDSLFEAFTSRLMSSFPPAPFALFNTFPCEEFLDGILAVLFKLADGIANAESLSALAVFLIDSILFNGVHYFKLTDTFFNLLQRLMGESAEVAEVVFSKLADKQSLLKPAETRLSSTFSSSHEHKGLRNLGATCYANSAIQVLFHVPEFRDSILSADCDPSGWFFHFQLLFAKLSVFPSTSVDPAPFFSRWAGWNGRPVNVREQQDGFEFLQLLLDRVGDILPDAVAVFRGELQHEIVGVSKKYRSESTEKFTTISLDIANAKTLDESLDAFLLPDVHPDYEAPEQGTMTVHRFHRILHPPEILVVQLKRFDYDLNNGTRIKVTKHFTFPHVFDLARVTVSQEPVEYELFAVIVHIGTALAGHYFSYCKACETEWRTFNDLCVSPFDSQQLPAIAAGFTEITAANLNRREDTAYILCYRRKSAVLESETHSWNAKLVEALSKEIDEALLQSDLASNEYS